MSANADPFREIVKENSARYRQAEFDRETNFQIRSKEMMNWKIEYDIYVRAAVSFSIDENSSLSDLGIMKYDITKAKLPPDSV